MKKPPSRLGKEAERRMQTLQNPFPPEERPLGKDRGMGEGASKRVSFPHKLAAIQNQSSCASRMSGVGSPLRCMEKVSIG